MEPKINTSSLTWSSPVYISSTGTNYGTIKADASIGVLDNSVNWAMTMGEANFSKITELEAKIEDLSKKLAILEARLDNSEDGYFYPPEDFFTKET